MHNVVVILLNRASSIQRPHSLSRNEEKYKIRNEFQAYRNERVTIDQTSDERQIFE